MAVLAVALPAAGDTPPTQVGSNQPSTTAGKIPPIRSDDFQDYAFPVQQTTGEVRKTKGYFTFPDVYMRAYVITCFASPDQEAYFGGDIAQEECTKMSPVPLPPEYIDPSNPGGVAVQGGVGDAYLLSSRGGKGAKNTYGSFPAIKVRAIVFGSIPVSATVHLEQTVTNGYLDPLKAVNGNATGFKTNRLVYPGFPASPADEFNSGLRRLTYKNRIDGTLQLRLSDVAVDGRPVDVGTQCGTVSPVRLTVREPLGYWTEDGSVASRMRGTPGGFLPLSQETPPGYLDGNADIPAFTNCGSTAEDLDPLLTALISGPTNRVTAFLPVGISRFYFCDTPVADSGCTPAIAAAQRRMKALAVAIDAHKSPAEIRKLQAKLRPSDYTLPRVKASGSR